MAEVTEEMPNTLQIKGRWTRYLDGQVWKLIAGEDFDPINISNVRQSLYCAARARGLKATVRTVGNALLVQARPAGDSERNDIEIGQ